MSTETVNPFLTWAPPGQPMVIQIDHGAIDRMNVEIMRGFGVTRRRGTETGGVLLGRIDRRAPQSVIHIQDFEAVACEYAFGPSYILSAVDQQRFKETVAKWQPSLDRDSYVVGYFRSHTREGFALDEKDSDVVRAFFPDPLDVTLLVKPFATRAATAGFFLKEKGALVTAITPLEFKFETPARLLTPAVEQPAAAPAPPRSAPAPRPQLRPAPESIAEPRVEPRVERPLFAAHIEPPSVWPRRLACTGFCLALLAFGAACGYEYAGRAIYAQRRQAIKGTPGGLPNTDLYALRLQVARAGTSVMIKWDRDSAPIQAALHGVLTVTEGASSKDVRLGFAELRNGTAMYPLVAPEIRFRLEVFFKDNRSFVESAAYSQSTPPR